jgi:hypothetical protein
VESNAPPSRTLRLLPLSVGLGLALLFAAQATNLIALIDSMPLFHPVDEVYHFDYVVKMARGELRELHAPFDPSVRSAVEITGQRGVAYYERPKPGTRGHLPESAGNYEIFHPPLYYRSAAWLVSPGDQAPDRVADVRRVRLAGVLAFLAAAPLWSVGLSRLLGRRSLAPLLTAMLWAWTRLEMFRVANDVAAHALAGLSFWVLSWVPRSSSGGPLPRSSPWAPASQPVSGPATR